MEKIRLFTIRILTAIAAVCFIFCACCIDAGTNIPFYGCLISGAWLALVFWANFDMLTGKKPQRTAKSHKKPHKTTKSNKEEELLSYD